MRALLAAVVTLACLSACPGSANDAESGQVTAPNGAIDKMALAFNGSPSTQAIREAMDKALAATDTPVSEENYSRAGSVLVAFRKEYGIDEMDILACIPTTVTDPRVPSLTLANVAAVCNVKLVSGE